MRSKNLRETHAAREELNRLEMTDFERARAEYVKALREELNRLEMTDGVFEVASEKPTVSARRAKRKSKGRAPVWPGRLEAVMSVAPDGGQSVASLATMIRARFPAEAQKIGNLESLLRGVLNRCRDREGWEKIKEGGNTLWRRKRRGG